MKDFDGFRPRYSIHGNGQLPSIERHLIADSTTLKEGSAVNLGTEGVEDLDGASEDFYGYVVGFEDADGFNNRSRVSGFSGGTYTQAATGDTYVSGTNDTVVALIIHGHGTVCSAKLSGAIDTTATAKPGRYVDVSTSILLDETSISDTKAQFIYVKGVSTVSPIDSQDPSSTVRVMVRGVELEVSDDA